MKLKNNLNMCKEIIHIFNYKISKLLQELIKKKRNTRLNFNRYLYTLNCLHWFKTNIKDLLKTYK